MGVDDRIAEALEHLAEPGSVEPGLVERLAKRKRRHRVARRVQAVTLVVAVLAGTAGGGLALYKAFRPDHATPTTPPVGNGLIAFVSDHEGTDDVYVVRPDGSDLQRLTADAGLESELAWSPDGQFLAFRRYAHDADDGIYVMRADGSERRRVPTKLAPVDFTPPVWTPDGALSYVAMVSDKEDAIVVIDIEGNVIRTITPPIDQHPSGPSMPDHLHLLPFDWSPDGTQIVEPGPGGLWFFDQDGKVTDFVAAKSAIFQSAIFWVEWSPDGTRVAGLIGKSEGWIEGGYPAPLSATHVAVLDLRDRRITQITSGDDTQDRAPSWSPDGNSIVFTRRPAFYDGKKFPPASLYVVTPGGDPHPLLEGGGDHRDPAWQPVAAAPLPGPTPQPTPSHGPGVNGTVPGFDIAYATDQHGDSHGGPFVIEESTLDFGVIGSAGGETSDQEPAFSPDGRTLSFTKATDSGTDIWLSDATQENPRPLVTGEGDQIGAVWSPDGNQIALTSIRGDTFIEVVNADGSGRHRITDGKASDFTPAWSPNGSAIAFARNVWDYPDIWLMAPDGSDQRQLTRIEGSEDQPAWSPDGSQIVFVFAPGKGGSDLLVMDADGSDVRALALSTGAESSPAWSPDGRWIIFASGDENASDLYLVQSDGTGLRQLTDTPARETGPVFNPAAFGAQCGLPLSQIELTARDSGFDRECLFAHPAARLKVTFRNLDSVQHSFSVLRGDTPIYESQPVSGPNTREHSLPRLEPGTYRFQCDLHPSTMNGRLLVE